MFLRFYIHHHICTLTYNQNTGNTSIIVDTTLKTAINNIRQYLLTYTLNS